MSTTESTSHRISQPTDMGTTDSNSHHSLSCHVHSHWITNHARLASSAHAHIHTLTV